MIRWSYVVPRLAVLLAVAAAVHWGLDPLLKRTAVEVGQTVLGAKIEIGSLATALRRGELRLTGVQAANPKSPLKNLFEAGEVTASIELAPLAERRLVIHEAKVTGLRLDTDRTTSGELDRRGGPGLPWPDLKPLAAAGEKTAEVLAGWLQRFAALTGRELAAQLEEFESVKLGREFATRWPWEYQQMESRLMALQQRAEALERVVQNPPQDPSQALGWYQYVNGQFDQMRTEVGQLVADAQRLQNQAASDKDRLVAAGRNDRQQLDQWRKMAMLDPNALSEYFLGKELSGRLATVLEWIQRVRSLLPERQSEESPPEPERNRGRDILFARSGDRCDFLVRSLTLAGEGRWDGKPFTFSGTATGLTHQPQRLGQPAVVKLHAAGPAEVHLEAIVDRTTTPAKHRIVVECPALAQAARQLGRPDQVVLQVTPGSTHFWACLELNGEDLSGQIQLKQEGVQVVPAVAAAYGGAYLSAPLQRAAAQIRTLQAAVDLSGQVTRPRWALRCDLGPQIAAALGETIQRELATRQQQLMAQLDQRLQGEVSALEQYVAARQQEVTARLQVGQQQLDQLKQNLVQRIPSIPGLPSAEQLLGQHLPGNLPAMPQGLPGVQNLPQVPGISRGLPPIQQAMPQLPSGGLPLRF